MFPRTLFAVVGLTLVSCTVHAAEASPQRTSTISPALGAAIDGFSLQDYRGKDHSLADWKDAKLVVVAFLGCDCPLAKLYGPRLAELAKEFAAQGVAFVGVNSNRQDSITEIAAYARIHGLDFPILKDAGNELADRFGAQRTPQVFVLDAERTIRYAGRIDDQYGLSASSGYSKPQVNQRHLADALTALLASKPLEQASTEAPGCIIGRVRQPDATAEVTYSKHISRIMNRSCVECHRAGQIAPFALTNYEEVVGWAEMIDEVVREQRMPPWHADPKFGHFQNDTTLKSEERKQIQTWVAAGAPEGNPKDLPEPAKFAEGWLMPSPPDQIVYIADQPTEVQAEGTVEYQYFEVDLGFTEDKWVKVAECRAGNLGVVHHIIVFVRPPQGSEAMRRNRDARGFNFLAGFAPGTRPFVLPTGMAKKIPAGSKLVFQMHYTPNGSPQQDLSMIGLKFIDPSEKIDYQVATTNAINVMFEIPPGADDYTVRATRRLTRDTLVLSLFPHMHLRGKSFYYEARYPDGTKETLLDVPRYDFNWQNHYIFSEFKTLPKGTKLFCEAKFDNSENNLANPNPKEAVRWGDQTWEEMMIGWFDVALPVADADSVLQDAAAGHGEDDAESDDSDEEGQGQRRPPRRQSQRRDGGSGGN